MKKIILSIFICLFATAFASAQSDLASAFTAGIKAGADYSGFPSYPTFTNKGEFAYIGGFWANLNLGPINFQPELYATEKRTRVMTTQYGKVYTENTQITTADVPLLFGFRTGTSSLGIRIYTGPVLSLALSKVQSFTNDNYDALRINYKDQTIAWQFGAGLNVKKLSFDIRYEAGISKVGYGADINPVTGVQTSSTHLNVISLSVGYTLFASNGGYTYQ